MNNIYKTNYNYIKNKNFENCEKKEIKNNKFNIKNYKDNTIYSLNEVECFLNNFKNFFKYIKLYKILK